MRRKAVVLLSGGIDSAVCLTMARKEFDDVFPLFVDYGQAGQEWKAAQEVAGASWLPVTRLSVQLPRRNEDGYVPGRNGILLSMAFAYAEAVDAQHVFIGCNADDGKDYPDCRARYLTCQQEAAHRVRQDGKSIYLHIPLLLMPKAVVVSKARELDVPLHLTWSCYTPTEGGTQCGKCKACILRASALSA